MKEDSLEFIIKKPIRQMLEARNLDDLGELLLHSLTKDFGLMDTKIYLLDPLEDTIREYASSGGISKKEIPSDFIKKVDLHQIIEEENIIRIPLSIEELLGWVETTELNVSEDLKEFLSYAKLAISQVREYEILRDMATKNGLTELLNYRGYTDVMEKLMKESKENKKYLSIAMIDMDNFKELNDELRHLGANRVIRELGKIFSDNVRKKDYACRFGGDEFCIVMPNTEEKEAYPILENLRKTVNGHIFPLTKRKITFSVGLATYNPEKDILYTEEKLKEAADSALYQAKEHGRNTIYVFNAR